MKLKGKVEKYERIEIRLEKLSDCVKIKRPDGKIEALKPFFYQPVAISYDEEGFEEVSEDGEKILLARYTPDFFGKITIEAYLNNRLTEKTALEIFDSENHGYVEIGKKDKKYFSYTDGAPFFQ